MIFCPFIDFEYFTIEIPIDAEKITNNRRSGQKSKTKGVLKSVKKMEHKNKWYKFGSNTWCYKPLPMLLR